MIIHGDCLDELKKLEPDSVDLVCTDPPYGYSFMGKDWDKAVPSVEVWQECLRVLKPGAFCFVMSAPRSDVQMHMIENLTKAGFRVDFTPIYWTYASGFPKAGNIGKLVDKRLGAEREVVGVREDFAKRSNTSRETQGEVLVGHSLERGQITKAQTDQAKALDGSYAGFQPKPAIEVVLVAMKPLSEKTYVDQAMKNGKGVTWLDDGRIPTDNKLGGGGEKRQSSNFEAFDRPWKHDEKHQERRAAEVRDKVAYAESSGRFPANLLVSDDVLNDGRERKSGDLLPGHKQGSGSFGKIGGETITGTYGGDSGSYSRYFDIDKWWSERLKDLPESVRKTFPFMIVPKASKSEKGKGCTHPTVKPLKLMSYLVTLGSRPGDTVLDPFVGSGTTCLAAETLGRKSIGIEREKEYVEIAEARIKSAGKQQALGL